MGTIATGLQTRWKDCYAPSDTVRLTLRTNGEEYNSIVTPQGSVVKAGFDAPETTPTGSVGSGGTLDGYYVYCYVYASTKYPYVQASTTTSSGEQWPRSNPSPMSAVQDCSAGSKTVTLTVTKTTRSDVDKILIYRTQAAETSAAAQALADAGTLYYIGETTNNGIAGTAAFSDTGITDTGEALELDNYTSDTAWFCLFDGKRWWAAGNPTFTADVTLDGTSAVTITGATWFDGRDGQIARFDGVATGGFDGASSFYFKWISPTTATMYEDIDLTTPTVVPFTGTTTITVVGRQSVLYKSKNFNPFSWGFTETQVNEDGSVTSVPQSFALELGGGSVTAMALVGNGRYLKIDFENPQRTIRLDLEFAEEAGFGQTQIDLNNQGSTTAHFAQFQGMLNGQPVLLGLDTYNGKILACDGSSITEVGDELGDFLLQLDRENDAIRFFHGCYDAGTELNCFWARLYDTDERNNVMFWIHGPTGMCGWMPDFDVLCSAVCLDSTTNERLVMGGTELGFMGNLLARGVFSNWCPGLSWTFLVNAGSPSGREIVPANQDIAGSPVIITQTSPAAGVLRISSLVVATGQNVQLYYNETDTSYLTYRVESIYLISDSLWEVTLDSAYSSSIADINICQHPKYYGNTWMCVTNVAYSPASGATNLWFAKCDYNSLVDNINAKYDADYTIEVGSTEIVSSGALPWPSQTADSSTYLAIYLGGIPTSFRSYFDLETPTKDKSSKEFWITANQHDTDTYATNAYTFPGVRFYNQFSDTYNTSFALSQDTIADGSTSLAFFNKTDVPSLLLKSFGIEMIECGQNNYTLYNYTVKVKDCSS